MQSQMQQIIERRPLENSLTIINFSVPSAKFVICFDIFPDRLS